MRLRILRDRGDDYADVAPLHAPDDWTALATALAAVTAKAKPVRSKDDLPKSPVFPTLEELGSWLEPNFAEFSEAFSQDNYPETRFLVQRVQMFPPFVPATGRFVRIGPGGRRDATVREEI